MEPIDYPIVETFKHVVFNPISASYGYSPLRTICEAQEQDGWVLERIVPHHLHESVAVFSKMGYNVTVEEGPETFELSCGCVINKGGWTLKCVNHKQPTPSEVVFTSTKEQTIPVVCRCGDWTHPGKSSCGPNGCYNCPA